MSWPQELLSPQDQQQLETQHYLFQQQQAQFSQQYEHFQQYIQQPQPQPQPQLEFQQSTQQQLHFVDIPTESTTTGPFQTIRTEDLSHPPEPVVSHFSAVNHGLATPQPFFNQRSDYPFSYFAFKHVFLARQRSHMVPQLCHRLQQLGETVRRPVARLFDMTRTLRLPVAQGAKQQSRNNGAASQIHPSLHPRWPMKLTLPLHKGLGS